MDKLEVIAFTDGACSGNPGPGGWGVLLRCGAHEKELSGGVAMTTNNAMELTAVLESVRALRKPCVLVVYTDSANVVGWLSGGWKRKHPGVQELCREIEALANEKGVVLCFGKLKGHAGHRENERVDALARAGIPHS